MDDKKTVAALNARIDLLEDEVNRLYERIVAFEKKIEELELMSEATIDEAEIELHEADLEKDQSLLHHLINEAKSASQLNVTPHHTLTIDLSNKDL